MGVGTRGTVPGWGVPPPIPDTVPHVPTPLDHRAACLRQVLDYSFTHAKALDLCPAPAAGQPPLGVSAAGLSEQLGVRIRVFGVTRLIAARPP